MFTVRATKKLLVRVKHPIGFGTEEPTTALGDWYATALFWQPQVALFVNEKTLLPVLVPLAPAATLLERFPDNLVAMLELLEVRPSFIASERWCMSEGEYAKTASRSLLGVMNSFASEIGRVRDRSGADLLMLSIWESQTPVGPLFERTGTPLGELLSIVEASPR